MSHASSLPVKIHCVFASGATRFVPASSGLEGYILSCADRLMQSAAFRGPDSPSSDSTTLKASHRLPHFHRMGQFPVQHMLPSLLSSPRIRCHVLLVLTPAQTVTKHHHISHPPPDAHASLMDSLSDTFINAFSRVRKPDARFVEMMEGLERTEEGLSGVERLVGRGKNRIDGE